MADTEPTTDPTPRPEGETKKKKKKKNKKKNQSNANNNNNNTNNVNDDKESSSEEVLVREMETTRLNSLLETMNSNAWKLEKEKGALKIYRLREEGDVIHKIKGVINLKGVNFSLFHEWMKKYPETLQVADPMFTRGEVLKSPKENIHLFYGAFKMPGVQALLISDRDFVWLNLDAEIQPNKQGCSLGYSIDSKLLGVECPDQKGYVRADIKESGYIYTVVDEDTIELVYVLQVDPKGWLPVWLVNLVAADQAENVFRIKKFAEENLAIKKEAEEGSEAEDNKEDSKEDSKETKANNNNNNNNAEGSKKKKKKKKKKGQQKRDTEVAILG